MNGQYMTKRPEYQCWRGMLDRCFNPGNIGWVNYGGRGITVCDRWRSDFWAFLADVGPRPSLDLSLDRYPNPIGNYEPGNVRWATQTEQSLNRAPREPREVTNARLLQVVATQKRASAIGVTVRMLARHERGERVTGWAQYLITGEVRTKSSSKPSRKSITR